MTSNARSMMEWTSSGSSRSDIAVKPETSENITVTLFRSPSSAAFEVRIFSARCLGVYVSGAVNFSGAGALGRPHSEQNLAARAISAPQPAQRGASAWPHSEQNLAFGPLSRRHLGHVTTRVYTACASMRE